MWSCEPDKISSGDFISPLNLRGGASLVDEGFFPAVARVNEKVAALQTNVEQLEKQIDTKVQKAQAGAAAQQRSKEEKAAAERKKKFDEAMAKVAQLQEQKKYGEAIGQLPKAADFPEFAEQIQARNEELRSLHGQLSMF